MLSPDNIIAITRSWLTSVVIELNLCPFAKATVEQASIHFAVNQTAEPIQLLSTLHQELLRLRASPDIETTLVIFPNALVDFLDYNAFLATVDDWLVSEGLEGEFQVASFHPDYQFAGTAAADAENFTNRSPFPMLHLLRESSVEWAIASHPNVHSIPENNIETMRRLGSRQLLQRLAQCFRDTPAG